MGSRRMENEEKEEPIGYLLHGERCHTSLWPSWRTENEKVTPGEKHEAFREFSILHLRRRRS